MTAEEVLAAIEASAWKEALGLSADAAGYARTWKRVSVALQRALRKRVPEIYFEDIERYQDRAAAYTYVVYASARVCYREFFYDAQDPDLISGLTSQIAVAMKKTLEPIEERLVSGGFVELGEHYSPHHQQKILGEAIKKPKGILALFVEEAALINAVIALGTMRTNKTAQRFLKVAEKAARRMTQGASALIEELVLGTATAALTEIERETKFEIEIDNPDTMAGCPS